eukprot:snap_masked-scaffold_1-processed-gene-13.4-mRNA-1 protein AED:1.00 eAED:1.00 QI:0/-1/0/0/-1/1/1/0/506
MAEANTESVSDKGPGSKDVTLDLPMTPSQTSQMLNPEAVSPHPTSVPQSEPEVLESNTPKLRSAPGQTEFSFQDLEKIQKEARKKNKLEALRRGLEAKELELQLKEQEIIKRESQLSNISLPVNKEVEEVSNQKENNSMSSKNEVLEEVEVANNDPHNIEIKPEAKSDSFIDEKKNIYPEKESKSPKKFPNSQSSARSYTSKAPPPKYPLSLTSKKSDFKDGQSVARSRITLNTTSTDGWSETGSSFIDRKQFSRPFKQLPLPEIVTNAPARSGHPLVQVSLPKKLSELTGEAIEVFLHEYTSVAHSVPGLTIQSLLTKKVSDYLYLRGVQVGSSRSVLRYLHQHLEKYAIRKRKKCLTNLKHQLMWPTMIKILEDQIYDFFDQVNNILEYLKEEELKMYKKKIFKILLEKISKRYELSFEEYSLSNNSFSLSKLRKLLIKYSSIIDSVTSIKNHSKQQSNQLFRPLQQDRKNIRARVIKVGRLGEKSRDITVMIYNPLSKEYQQI